MKHVVRIGEFFSGPGGMSLGAIRSFLGSEYEEQFEIEPVWAVDFDADSCATYHHNIHRHMPMAKLIDAKDETKPAIGIDWPQGDYPVVINADVRKVQPKLLGDVDGFFFGFPCNDFSMAGERKGTDGSFGRLYRQGIELINVKRPKFFVAENVSGLLNANNYGAFSEIMAELEEAGKAFGGYQIVPHLYKFDQYGVPQTRHRVLIVGIRKDMLKDGGSYKPPLPSMETVTAREALEGISGNPSLPNNAPKRINDTVRRRIEMTPPGKNIWDVNDILPEELRLKKDMKAQMSSIYKVLDPDKPAYTVVGAGGGGTHMYHWEKRATTDRERATLQTFPYDYEFKGSVTSVRKQIGMAVPPLGASIIVGAVIKTIHGIAYDHVEPNLAHATDPAYIEKRRAAAAKSREKKLRAAEAKAFKEAQQEAAQESAIDSDTSTVAPEMAAA